MKCPDKDLTDGLHDMFEDTERKKVCPKCGSEMETRLLHENPEGTGRSMLVWYCQNCGHEEKVQEMITDHKGLIRNCPKCGRFMRYFAEPLPNTSTPDCGWQCDNCCHEEKVR